MKTKAGEKVGTEVKKLMKQGKSRRQAVAMALHKAGYTKGNKSMNKHDFL